jgi:nicotinamidase-related amidase
MPPAFIILDVQNDFFDSANPNHTGFLNTISVINHTAAFFRRHHWPVIFIQHTSSGAPGGCHGIGHRSGFVECRCTALPKFRNLGET